MPRVQYEMPMVHRLLVLIAFGWLALLPLPASAAVTITFWSHDQDSNFPHTFFALKGTPDAGGPALDENYGFTAKAITPVILLGSVAGEVQTAKSGYIRRSDAQFSVVLTDAQLAQVQALVQEWWKAKYNLNKRNCVHFVAEALRRSGVTVPELPKLMKKPKSFLVAVGRANGERVTQIRLDGAAYIAAYGVPGAAKATAETRARPVRRPAEVEP